VTAAIAIANIVKSSLGPVGLDKMLVDDIGARARVRRPANPPAGRGH
jgi:chaperonin GroEL (HSP60 family)